ncbi:MAG: M23 family metallopeptidase [candidate division WOR-3 bacterium]
MIMAWLRKKESQILGYPWGAVLILIAIGSCKNPFSSDLPDTATLSASPVEPADCGWIGPYGTLYEMSSTRFHNGIDFNTVSGGRFLACADGEVKKIELNTGAGLPGTNYRITITVAKNLELDYHFEIGGSVSEAEREKNILVTKGKKVKAGQHIANLIVVDSDIAHVHFCVLEKGNATKCPLDYFSKDIANLLEQLYDAKPQVYSHSLNPNLCN